MHRAAVWVPNDSVALVRLETPEVLGNPQLRDVWTEELAGAYVPTMNWEVSGRPLGAQVTGIRDDNRSALLTEHRVVIREREYVVAVKGCGAAFDAYEHAPITPSRVRSLARSPAAAAALPPEADGSGFITGERWFGNAPYGGQAPDNAAIGLLTSLRADRNEIAGFFLCPIVALVRIPDAVAAGAAEFYWYRRYEGSYWQEIRLVPSNVRLYFHSPITFGVDTARAFALFELSSLEACEAFLENLARSSLAALTLFARSLRADPRTGGYRGLAYHDVWLDKDAVIAPDGTLHFADIEGVEDVGMPDLAGVQEEIRRQFHRNVYEATYGLEALAREADRRFRFAASPSERREWVVDVLARASRTDPYVRVERDRGGLVAHVEPAVDPDRGAVDLEIASRRGG